MDAAVAQQTLNVTSKSFTSQAPIPTKHGYLTGNISPQLSWSVGPAGTKSYVVICQDPDAPRKDPWVHWVMFHIPATIQAVAEGMPNSLEVSDGIRQGLNDYPDSGKQIGWGGPNPPSGTHRYYFYVYALDSDLPELKGKNPTKKELMQVMKKHKILAQGELMGTYKAS